MSSSPSEVLQAFYDAIQNGQHGAALRPFLTEDVELIEHPNQLRPKGARMDLQAILEGSSRGASLLAWQRYDVRSTLTSEDRAAVQTAWHAEIALDLGPFRAGQQLRAQLAQFVTCREGRIARLETYDCYEPWQA